VRLLAGVDKGLVESSELAGGDGSDCSEVDIGWRTSGCGRLRARWEGC